VTNVGREIIEQGISFKDEIEGILQSGVT